MESERRQATRWIQAAAYVRTGKFNEEETWFVLSGCTNVPCFTSYVKGECASKCSIIPGAFGWYKIRFWMVAGNDPSESLRFWADGFGAFQQPCGSFFSESSEEKDLFLRCQEIAKAHKANMDTKVRDWLQSLHAWVTSHNKPRWNASDPEEKQQAQRLKTAQQRLKAGKLNLAEERLFQSCVTFLQSSA